MIAQGDGRQWNDHSHESYLMLKAEVSSFRTIVISQMNKLGSREGNDFFMVKLLDEGSAGASALPSRSCPEPSLGYIPVS